MKKIFRCFITIILSVIMLSSCNLEQYLSSMVSNLQVSSTSSQTDVGGSNEGCKVYENLDVLVEEEEVSLLSASTSLQDVFDEVTKSTFMATACYVVNGVQYEQISSGFIIERKQLENEYQYFLVSSASQLFYRNVNNQGNTIINRNPEYIEIVLGDYRRYYTEVVNYYERYDIVILSFKTKDELNALSLGDSDTLQIGDSVAAIGTPSLGISVLNTLIRGNISLLDKTSTIYYNDEQVATFTTHQFDAPTNDGMQGGPVINSTGEVVGLLTYKYGGDSDYESLSRFIPINNLKNCINGLINDNNYAVPTLGVSVMDLYIAISQDQVSWPNGVGLYEGVYIVSVDANTKAGKAGVVGDGVATKVVNGKTYNLRSMADLSTALSRYDANEPFVITVVYKNETKEFTIDLNA